MVGSRRGSRLAAQMFGSYSQQALMSVTAETQQDLFGSGENSPTVSLAGTLDRAMCNKDGLFVPREVFDLPDDEMLEILKTQPERRDEVLHYIYPLRMFSSTLMVVDEGEGGRGVIFFHDIQDAVTYCLTILTSFCFLTHGPAKPTELKERFVVGARWTAEGELNFIPSAENFFAGDTK